jgi:hypothetical protein
MNKPPVGGEGPYVIVCHDEKTGDMIVLTAGCERCLETTLRVLMEEPQMDSFRVRVERGGKRLLEMGERLIGRGEGGREGGGGISEKGAHT